MPDNETDPPDKDIFPAWLRISIRSTPLIIIPLFARPETFCLPLYSPFSFGSVQKLSYPYSSLVDQVNMKSLLLKYVLLIWFSSYPLLIGNT